MLLCQVDTKLDQQRMLLQHLLGGFALPHAVCQTCTQARQVRMFNQLTAPGEQRIKAPNVCGADMQQINHLCSGKFEIVLWVS